MEERQDAIKTVYKAVIANGLLAGSKFVIGLLTGSVSIIADAVNNLSDFMTTCVMIFGLKASSKPADSEHPYGHERLELIGGLIVSIILIYAGIDVLTSSFEQFRNPGLHAIHGSMWVITILSCIIKGFMMLMYKQAAKKHDSGLLEAGFQDSRNDVLIGFSLLLGFFVHEALDIAIDGVLGVSISCIILWGAFVLLRDTVTVLVGKRPSQRDVDAVVSILDNHKTLHGYHDLLIHTYGKKHKFGTVHIEVDGTMSLKQAHDIAHTIEEEIKNKLGFELVIHLDPVDYDDKEYRQKITDALFTLPYIISYHDLIITKSAIAFDVVVDNHCEKSDDEVKVDIHQALKVLKKSVSVTVDRNYLL